jgi:hypothetical protein
MFHGIDNSMLLMFQCILALIRDVNLLLILAMLCAARTPPNTLFFEVAERPKITIMNAQALSKCALG